MVLALQNAYSNSHFIALYETRFDPLNNGAGLLNDLIKNTTCTSLATYTMELEPSTRAPNYLSFPQPISDISS